MTSKPLPDDDPPSGHPGPSEHSGHSLPAVDFRNAAPGSSSAVWNPPYSKGKNGDGAGRFGKRSFGRALRCVSFGAVAALGALEAPKARAGIVFAADEPASLALGEQMARDDKVRFLTITNLDNGAVINGTATPLGEWYTGISKHWVTYAESTFGTTNFAITVSTGATRNNLFQTTRIVSFDQPLGLDYLIAQHQDGFIGARKPQFSPAFFFQNLTVVGAGNRQLFYSNAIVNDGKPMGWNMTVSNTSDPTFVTLDSSFALPIEGGAVNFDSTASAYDDSNRLVLVIQGGTITPMAGESGNYGLAFVSSGLGAYIDTHTPLNSIPELHVFPVGSAIRLTWNAGAAGFRLKTSDDLSIWRDLGGVLTGPGSYDDPIDNRPSQFYRLVKP